jgi:hypothetical protein
MDQTFFKLLRQEPKVEFALLEQLWWEWSHVFEAYEHFALIYYKNLGHWLHIFTEIEAKKQSINYTKVEFLLRYQPLSRCLDYYNNVLSAKYLALKGNAIHAIRTSNQFLIDQWLPPGPV